MAIRPNATAPEDVWEVFCADNPKDQFCIDNIPTHYEYDLALLPNAIFLGIMAASFLGYAATLALTRRGTAFNIAMMLGTLTEVLGYAGRVMSWKNPWAEIGFLMQICCLTIAPAFLAAGIYLCLRRIVYVFGKENSLIAPEWYTRIVSSNPSVPGGVASYSPISQSGHKNTHKFGPPPSLYLVISSPSSSKPSAAPSHPSPPATRTRTSSTWATTS
jgi:hypothetical protein